VECNLPGMGHMLNLFRFKGPPGNKVFRLFLIVLAFVFGIIIGRKLLHDGFFRNWCKLGMFEGNKGSWFCMGTAIGPCFLIAIGVYNLAVATEHAIDGATGMQLRVFGKVTQCCSVTADLIAIIMVADGVLQEEKMRYPNFAPRFRSFYSHGLNGFFRVLSVWVVALASVVGFGVGILSTGREEGDITWDDRNIGGITEVARAFVVLAVFFCDLFTVVQDWEFPLFKAAVDIKVAGTFSTELKCGCVKRCAERLPSPPTGCRKWLPDANFFHVTVTGPWLSYGPLLIVIGLDLFCMRTQMLYSPNQYGQYVHPDTQRVWTIVDQDYLLQAYNRGVLNQTDMITYGARWNNITGQAMSASALTDIELSSRYLGSNIKYVAIIPSFSLVVIFWVLVWLGNAQKNTIAALDRGLSKITDSVESGISFVGHIVHHPLVTHVKPAESLKKDDQVADLPGQTPG